MMYIRSISLLDVRERRGIKCGKSLKKELMLKVRE
ncbi:hypothetical protein RDABS01_014480 [Bienertia sinuspersici]